MTVKQKQDWHREDVAAAIRKTGLPLTTLSKRHGYSPMSVAQALRHPWPAVERIIATHLGLKPSDIWPSRYDADGEPLHGGWTYHKRNRAAAQRQTEGVA